MDIADDSTAQAVPDQARPRRGRRRQPLAADPREEARLEFLFGLKTLDLNNVQIAEVLGISDRTVRRYLATAPTDDRRYADGTFHGRGGTKIEPPVMKLMRLMLKGKITPDDVRNA